MSSAPAIPTRTSHSPWPHRLRLALVITLASFGFHWIASQGTYGLGLHRPLVFFGGAGLIAAVGGAALILAGVFVTVRILRDRTPRDALMIVGWCLAIWAAFGGNMDDWLILRNPKPGPGTGGAYLSLLSDYVLMLLICVGALALVSFGTRRGGSLTGGGSLPERFGFEANKDQLRDGLIALAVTVAVAVALMHIAVGPRFSETRRGQIYFAVFVSHMLGVVVARQAAKFDSPLWVLPAPFLTGLIGLIFASIRPALPVPYDQINIIPVWGAVRALPAEMIGVGLIATLWMFPARSSAEAESASATIPMKPSSAT